MDRLALQDLIEGRNEWCNIPDVIRETFKDFSVLLTNQAAQIRALDETIQIMQKPKQRDERLSVLEQDILEVQKVATRNRSAIETLNARVGAKADTSDVTEQMTELKRSVDARMQQKADVSLLNSGLASRVPLRLFEEQMALRLSHEQMELYVDRQVRWHVCRVRLAACIAVWVFVAHACCVWCCGCSNCILALQRLGVERARPRMLEWSPTPHMMAPK